VTTQPDTDAPPTGPWGPTDLFPIEEIEPDHFASDAPQAGRPTTPQTEADVYSAEAIDDGRGWVIPVEESGRWYISRSRAAAGALPSVERLAAAMSLARSNRAHPPITDTDRAFARSVLAHLAPPEALPEASER
jgi:hypothetical protein